MNQMLQVRIISPRELILDTQAQSVSSKNTQGSFDILPKHANFITLIDNQPIQVRIKGQKPLNFKFPIAIIFATEDKVNVYTYVTEEGEKEISPFVFAMGKKATSTPIEPPIEKE